jgi:hypothetical protein
VLEGIGRQYFDSPDVRHHVGEIYREARA